MVLKEHRVYKGFMSLPPMAKGAIVLGAGVAIYFAARGFIKRIKDQAQFKNDIKEASLADNQLKALAKQGIYPTIPESQMESICLLLVQAMNGCSTDYGQVETALTNVQNDADMYLLIKQFGIRYYRPCEWTQPISWIRYLNDDKTFGGTLSVWVSYAISSIYIKAINGYLKSKGLNYQF